MNTVVVGVTHNAKAGAVLVADDGRAFFFAGMDSWPGEYLSKRVEVSGRVEHEEHDEPLVNDRGEHKAGMSGTQTLFVEGFEYRLAD